MTSDLNTKYINTIVYTRAEEFLQAHLPAGLTPADLEKYYDEDRRRIESINDVFENLIESAQNYQSMPNVIGFATVPGRREQIKEMLNGFDAKSVWKEEYKDHLFDLFCDKFDVKNRDSKQNSWRKWANSIVDCAKFLVDFESVEEFKEFVEQFNYNSATRTALPLYMSEKIKGIGFALACDALKNMGFSWYAKPDVHMIEICSALELSGKDQLSVFEALVRMAEDNDVTPAKCDKVLWLICSGHYHKDHDENGKDLKVRGLKKEFIEYAQRRVAIFNSVMKRMESDMISESQVKDSYDEDYYKEFVHRQLTEDLKRIHWGNFEYSDINLLPKEIECMEDRMKFIQGIISSQKKRYS